MLAPTWPKRLPFERRRTSSMLSNFRDGSKPRLSQNSLLLKAIQCPALGGECSLEDFQHYVPEGMDRSYRGRGVMREVARTGHVQTSAFDLGYEVLQEGLR